MAYGTAAALLLVGQNLIQLKVESDSGPTFLFEHDLRANASRLSLGKAGSYPPGIKSEGMLCPDHAPVRAPPNRNRKEQRHDAALLGFRLATPLADLGILPSQARQYASVV